MHTSQKFSADPAPAVIFCRPKEQRCLLQVQDMSRIFHRTLNIVGYHHHRNTGIPVDSPDELVELARHDRIQTCHRLVEQEQAFCGAQRARQEHPLFLASREIPEALPLQIPYSEKFHFLHCFPLIADV